MNIRTRRGRAGFLALFIAVGAAVFSLIGGLGPIAIEALTPASFWLTVQEARITDYDPLTVVASYVWHRTARRDLVVDTYITLIETNGREHQTWHIRYEDSFFEEGEREIIFEGVQGLQNFPDLESGTYELEGLLCFLSPHGVRKHLPFQFTDYVVREAE